MKKGEVDNERELKGVDGEFAEEELQLQEEEQLNQDKGGSSDQTREQESQKEGEGERQNEEQDYRDKYIRLAAEFDNYRKRTLKERMELTRSAGEDIISGLLPVLDDFERALEMLSNDNNNHSSAVEGTTLIYNKFKEYLKSRGLKEVEAIGKELDTDFHEAVAQFPVDSKKKRNRVIDVVQKGYTLHGKVIRFAKVVVGQ